MIAQPHASSDVDKVKWPFHRRYADARRGVTEVVARLHPAASSVRDTIQM
jgi:hypothetical protein